MPRVKPAEDSNAPDGFYRVKAECTNDRWEYEYDVPHGHESEVWLRTNAECEHCKCLGVMIPIREKPSRSGRG